MSTLSLLVFFKSVTVEVQTLKYQRIPSYHALILEFVFAQYATAVTFLTVHICCLMALG